MLEGFVGVIGIEVGLEFCEAAHDNLLTALGFNHV